MIYEHGIWKSLLKLGGHMHVTLSMTFQSFVLPISGSNPIIDTPNWISRPFHLPKPTVMEAAEEGARIN